MGSFFRISKQSQVHLEIDEPASEVVSLNSLFAEETCHFMIQFLPRRQHSYNGWEKCRLGTDPGQMQKILLNLIWELQLVLPVLDSSGWTYPPLSQQSVNFDQEIVEIGFICSNLIEIINSSNNAGQNPVRVE
jgi:hypothetical protein